VRYHTQWDDAALTFDITGDDPPPGWTKRFSASGAPADYSRYVRNGGLAVSPATVMPVKRRFLRTAQTSSGTSRGVLSWGLIDSDAARADGEIVALYIVGGNREAGAYAIARGSTSATTGYYAGFAPASDTIRIAKIVAGVATDLATAAFSLPAPAASANPASSAFWLRFRFQGTALALTVWAAGDAEPASPQLTASDSAISAVGFFGLWNEGASSQGAWNTFACCTGSSTAARPITETEFDAWAVRQDAQRCTLAVMNAIGFSPATADFTKDVPFYSSDVGYISHEQDMPASRLFPAVIAAVPSVRHEIGQAMRGRATIGAGTLEITNPKVADGAGGVRDSWLRQKWRKGYGELLWGDPSWPLHDFRVFFVGRVKPPTAQKQETISFPLNDLLEEFSSPLQPNAFGASTNYEGAYLPLAIGRPKYVEPPLFDTPNLRYKLHDGAIVDPLPTWTPAAPAIALDGNGNSLSGSTGHVVSSVSAALDTLTFTTAHGGSVGSVFVFDPAGAAPPVPLATGVKYYGQTIGSPTTAKLSATKGGAAIDITGSGTGATAYVHAFDIDGTNGEILPLVQPTRLVVPSVEQLGTNQERVANMLQWAIFTKYGLSNEFLDDDSFGALETLMIDDGYDAGVWVDRNGGSVDDIVKRITEGSNTWVGAAPDGPVRVGRLDLPSATDSAMDFTEKDVAEGSLQQLASVLPIDFSQTDVRYRPVWLTGGPYLASGVDINSLLVPKYSYPAAATPIDTAPQGDVQPKSEFDTIFEAGSAEQTRLVSFFGKGLAMFSFQTHARAMRLKLGATITLTHSRKGWKVYTPTDPASPDNPGGFDARRAVVVAREVNVNANNPLQRVTLTVIRQNPMYAPEAAVDPPPITFFFDAANFPTLSVAGLGYTRATAAWEFDHEGFVRQLKSGEAPFNGFRREENLAQGSSQDFSNASWTKTTITVAGDKQTLTASAGNGEITQALTIAAALGTGSYVARFKVKRISGTGNIQLRMGATYTTIPVTSAEVSFAAPVASGAPGTFTWGLRIVANGDSVKVTYAGLHDVSGRANQNPPEEVSIGVLSTPYHGTGADGTQVFAYQNGNTVSATQVITDGYGVAISRATLKGMHIEPYTSTNRITAPRDWTNAAWSHTNLTPTRCTGMDGRANSATTLTAGTGGGHIEQALSSLVGAENSEFTVWIKRRTGTGNVTVRDQAGLGGTIFVPSTTQWTKCTVYGPYAGGATRTVGIILAGTNDAVDVDFGIEQTGVIPFQAASPIDTAVAATRNAAVCSATSGAIDKAQGAIYAEFASDQATTAAATMYPLATEASNAVRVDAAAVISGYLNGTVAASASVTWSPGQIVKALFRWNGLRSDMWMNGTRGAPAAGSALSGLSTTLYVGQTAAGAGSGVYISRLAVTKSFLTDDYCEDIST
jgi:hypothetical protein